MLSVQLSECNQDHAMTRHRFFSIATAALLLTACQGAQEPDCSPQAGFELGQSGEPPAEACDDRQYRESWQLGETLGELQRERDDLLARDDDLDTLEQMRLRVLSREIPELETLARLRGFLPAATLDDIDAPAYD